MMTSVTAVAPVARPRAQSNTNADTPAGKKQMSIVHVSDDTFEAEVLQADKPVLVDFWAEWCGPCKMIAPLLEQVAGEYADRLQVAKVDVEASQGTAMKFGIRSIPTLMLFRDGVVQAQHVGMLSKEQLSQLLDEKL
jgi:thioredoxin 1